MFHDSLQKLHFARTWCILFHQKCLSAGLIYDDFVAKHSALAECAKSCFGRSLNGETRKKGIVIRNEFPMRESVNLVKKLHFFHKETSFFKVLLTRSDKKVVIRSLKHVRMIYLTVRVYLENILL